MWSVGSILRYLLSPLRKLFGGKCDAESKKTSSQRKNKPSKKETKQSPKNTEVKSPEQGAKKPDKVTTKKDSKRVSKKDTKKSTEEAPIHENQYVHCTVRQALDGEINAKRYSVNYPCLPHLKEVLNVSVLKDLES